MSVPDTSVYGMLLPALEQSIMAAVLVDENNCVRYFNPAAERLWGYAHDEIIDRDMGDEMRGVRSLSGGERFLVSLGLALALSGLDGRQAFVDTLFIDEGFGSLDREALDVAVDALETLQGQGRKVGVVTHVAAMIERIPVRVSVEKRGGGRSIVRIPGWPEQVPRATAGS